MPEGLTVVQHPVLDDRLAVLRDASTPHGAFRQALSEASAILAVESTRDLPTVAHTIDTPLEPAPGRRLEAEITIVPVLRAGLGMVDGFLRLLPARASGTWACSATRTRSSRRATTSACRPAWARPTSSCWTRCWPPAAARSPRWPA